MEKQLKFFPLLSLQEMALRWVAVFLWNDLDVLASISKLRECNERRKEWKTIEDIVKDKLSKLELPESLIEQVRGRVTSVGLEILRWKNYLEEFLDFINFEGNGFPGSTKLCWTTTGRIDYPKTVKGLHCNAISVVNYYEIACHFCVEDCIAMLWEKLPEEDKEDFSHDDHISFGLSYQWPHILKGEYFKLDNWSREESCQSFNQSIFEHLILGGNITAAKYFFPKLKQEEREASITKSVNSLIESIRVSPSDDLVLSPFLKDSPCETFHYLLTLMTPETQMETLKSHPIPVFLSFFDMVWSDLFSENASLIWTHLPLKDYAPLQCMMAAKYFLRDNYCQQLLQEFFMQSPPDFKKYLVEPEYEYQGTPMCRFLYAFFKHKDSESVEAMFRSLDAADRVKVVFKPSVSRHLFENIFHEDKRDMVSVCLREALLSKEEIERLKEHFLERSNPEMRGEGQMLKSFFDCLDESDASADIEKKGQKRKMENCPLE